MLAKILVLRLKRIQPMTRSLYSHCPQGRIHNDYHATICSYAQEVPRKFVPQWLRPSDGHPHGPRLYLAPRADVLLVGCRCDCEPIHRGQLTRFLARPRWQKDDFNSFGLAALLQMETGIGVGQYQFERFEAVEAWINGAITTVLFLEQLRARRLKDWRLSEERRRWWRVFACFRDFCGGKSAEFELSPGHPNRKTLWE